MDRALCLFLVVVLLCGCHKTEGMQPPGTEETAMIQTLEEPATVKSNQKLRMEDILIVGDFRACGLRDYGCFPQSDFVCEPLMTVYNVWDSGAPWLLQHREYRCVIIGLGLNEAGYPMSGLRQAFQDWITYVLHTQPQARIVIQGLMPVGIQLAQQNTYTDSDRLLEINAMISLLAQQNRVEYVDFFDSFAGSDGYLLERYSVNGCHLSEEGARHWYGLLWKEINQEE